jgi:hypothetical protein
MPRKTAKRTSASRNTKSYEHIRRHWGDIEVVDAVNDLRVFVQPQDVASATKKDPGCCVFAQACKRQFAATKVMFWRSVAYVELPGPDGTRRVERFTMSPDMRDLIENFDKGNSVIPEAGFQLKAPRPSYTLDGKLAKQKRWKTRRKARIKGTRTGDVEAADENHGVGRGKGAYSKPAIVIDTNIRSGLGQVHFREKTEVA